MNQPLCMLSVLPSIKHGPFSPRVTDMFLSLNHQKKSLTTMAPWSRAPMQEGQREFNGHPQT